MIETLTEQLGAALAAFSGATRLYELTIGEDDSSLLVEAFVADDAVDDVGVRDVIVLSTSVHIDTASLPGQRAVLDVSLADGSRTRFAGDISEAAQLGSDGGFARFRIRMSSWLWRLEQVRNSRVWQDRTVIEIADDVFAAYLPLARWRWSDDTSPLMAEALPRSYCCQYRESDLGFVRRLLAEEGCAGASSTAGMAPKWCCSPTAARPARCRKTPAAQPAAASASMASVRSKPAIPSRRCKRNDACMPPSSPC